MKAEVQSYIHQAKASDFNPVAYMNYAEYIKSVLITENSAQGKKKEKKKRKNLENKEYLNMDKLQTRLHPFSIINEKRTNECNLTWI